MSFDESDLGMQPLSRVKPGAVIHLGDTQATMNHCPSIATKIAQCIAEYSEIEFSLAAVLAVILSGEQRAAIALYVGASSRTAQLAMIQSAADCSLDQDRLDILTIILNRCILPAMKERDRLAHWSWAHSEELPGKLILIDPTHKTVAVLDQFLSLKQSSLDRGKAFVVSETDLSRVFKRMRAARLLAGRFAGTLTKAYSDDMRAQHLLRLSNEPEIQEPLRLLREDRKNNPKSQP